MFSAVKRTLRIGGLIIVFSIFSSVIGTVCEHRRTIETESSSLLDAVNTSAQKLMTALDGALMLLPRAVGEPIISVFTAIDEAAGSITEYVLSTRQIP